MRVSCQQPLVASPDLTSPCSLKTQQSSVRPQAYNNWDGRGLSTGTSLYTFNSTNSVRAYKVSFDRPYRVDGSGDFFGWEVYLLQWMEQSGYDVTYTTDVDTDVNPTRLRSVKGVIIPGHSQYWPKVMYDAAQAARDAGVSLGFMGSNPVYWQSRYEGRVLVCYKTSEAPNPVDPLTASNPSLTTTQWRQTPLNRPEQTLVGIQFTSQTGAGWNSTVPFVVTNSANSVYANSGLTDGSSMTGLVGYETDRLWQEFPRPISQSQTAALLANSPYTNTAGAADFHNASVYQAQSGAWVFASGSQAWSWGLKRPTYVNAGIQQAATNVLNRFISNVPIAAAVTPTPTPTPAPSTYRNAVMADSPVGYWRFGEGSGTVAADQIGTHNGTYAYSPALAQPGALFNDPATSVGLNGTSQFVQAPSDASLNTSTFSFEVWARPTGGAGTYHGVMSDRYFPQGWILYWGQSGAWEFWISTGTGMVSIAGGTSTPNAWHHLVGTYDGTTARLYLNGVAVASAPVSGYQPQSRAPLEIGQGDWGSGYYFPGQLEEVALYNTALSQAQVQHHYSVATTGH